MIMMYIVFYLASRIESCWAFESCRPFECYDLLEWHEPRLEHVVKSYFHLDNPDVLETIVIFQELDASGEVDLKRAKVFWFREPAAGCKCLPQIWTTGAISYTTLNRILTVSPGENEARGWRRNPNRCHTCHPESLINMEIYTANLH